MSGLPGVSVLCATYGRTKVLPELIESYLRQTYLGPMELHILNDLDAQQLRLDVDTGRFTRPVIIHNQVERLPYLGDKCNVLLTLARHPLIAIWDDDDIYLPHHIASTVTTYQRWAEQGWHMGRNSHAWRLARDAVGAFEWSRLDGGALSAMVIERGVIPALGGFPSIPQCADVEVLRRMLKLHLVPGESNTPGMPGFVRRWRCTPYPQVTVLRHAAPEASGHDRAVDFWARTEALLASGEEPQGVIDLAPRWDHDYDVLARAAFGDRDRPNQDQPATQYPPPRPPAAASAFVPA